MTTTPPEPNKDDRMSLLKSLHRPYGQLDNGEDRYVRPDRPSEKHSKCHPHKNLGTILALVAAILVIVVVACVATLGDLTRTSKPFSADVLTVPEEEEEDGVIVKTNCGNLVGKIESGAFVFKGIPYAKPPVGKLRWRKPVPLWIDHTWCEGHRRQRAREFGNSCFQMNPYSKEYEGSEDCLYLNVWTPRPDISAGLEVMVWFHSGFLQFGSGNKPGLSPSGHLSRKLNVVFVSFNYRLFTLGFMALDVLVENILTDSPGNYGLWDQVVALQWVKDNIQNFGGDPNKVTLFGADAGGASILALMTSPIVQGLFRSSWLIGPTAIFNRTFNEVSLHNRAFFLRHIGCTDADCLRRKNPRETLDSHLGKDDPSFRIRDQNDLPIQGIYPEQLIVTEAGDLVKSPPPQSFRGEQINGIPVLLGTAAQAVDFWPGPDDIKSWTWSQYKKYVTTSLDSFNPSISKMAINLYNNTYMFEDNVTPEFLYTTMVSDVRQKCPVNTLADEMSKAFRAPIFRYVVTSFPSTPIRIYDYDTQYSSHLWDAIAFFDEMQLFIDNPDDDDRAFRDLLHKTILSFVRSGGAEVGSKEWLRFSKKMAYLSSNSTVMDSSIKECKFWSQHGLDVYAWVS